METPKIDKRYDNDNDNYRYRMETPKIDKRYDNDNDNYRYHIEAQELDKRYDNDNGGENRRTKSAKPTRLIYRHTAVCSCVPCPPGSRLAFCRFIVSLSFFGLSKIPSNDIEPFSIRYYRFLSNDIIEVFDTLSNT